MEINGNDVNNLFLGGNRFTNIADDYFLPVGTEFFGFSYSDIDNTFKLDTTQSSDGHISLKNSDYIFPNAKRILYGRPEEILKNYRPDAKVEATRVISLNARFYSLDKFNSENYIHLFTPNQFEKIKLSYYF